MVPVVSLAAVNEGLFFQSDVCPVLQSFDAKQVSLRKGVKSILLLYFHYHRSLFLINIPVLMKTLSLVYKSFAFGPYPEIEHS